jgi:hypothetical protein
MEVNPARPRVVKEFRFYPESTIVTIVFGDDTAMDFEGSENYHKARFACLVTPQPDSADLELMDPKGGKVAVTVIKGTPHETFEA